MSKLELPNRETDELWSAADRITVSSPEIRIEGDHAVLSCDVSGDGLPSSLWYRVPKAYADCLSLARPDWIFSSLLQPAMLRGATLVVDAPISGKLAFALMGDLQYILGQQDSRLQRVAISYLSHMIDGTYDGKAVGTGFSAGIDSFTSIVDATADDVPDSHRLTHLAVLNVGAMGPCDGSGPLFEKYSRRLESFCRHAGFDGITIDSNLDDFYKGDFTYQQGHTIRNASAILALQGLFQRYYYSSGFEYSKNFVGQSHDMASADPIILPLLSTENLEFVSFGSRYSRMEKVEKVASYAASYNFLDVCVGHVHERSNSDIPNCSTCWKCGRQLLALECLGKLDHYADVFDIDAYRSARPEVFAYIIENAYYEKWASDQEVINIAIAAKKIRTLGKFITPLLVKLAPIKGSLLIGKLNRRR